MYQAIVFLPLVGFLIAGAITLVGARARHPGGMSEGHDAGHHHAPAVSGGAVVHHDHHDDHAPAEPAAWGARPAEIATTSLLMISALLSWVALFYVGFQGHDTRVHLFTWIAAGDLKVEWALRIDTMTVVMFVVVNSVSALVHLYSIGYMNEDPFRPRFFAYLSLFTFAMLMLVTADNLVQLFFGWEGVGLASYLLIGFWYQKPEANAAAIKAFVVNRVGDFGFALGIFAVFAMTGAVGFETVFVSVKSLVGQHIHLLGHNFDALTIICLLLFMGAMGKSAQFLLHTWLPDAMEGPTPVSALIHAATMVTAGVFMVARLSPIFELAPTALTFVTIVGATTAFFAATIGLVQNDIKRVVAYSTCSQLGYMFVAMGMGAYSVGMFHLFTHAAFKALLFLGSGSVIHAMHHEQDMRKMGGLRTKIPFTYWMMVIGTLALTGFPFTAGYYSKDAIIESAAAGHGSVAEYAFWLTVIAAGLTSFYSWRLIFMTFHGKTRADHHTYDHAHESPLTMLIPLALLATGALVLGFAFHSVFTHAHDVEGFFRESLFSASGNKILEEMHHIPMWAAYIPTAMMALGFVVAWWFYIASPGIPHALAEANPVLYRFLLNKWYFDEIYDFVFVRPAKWLGRFFWKKGDGWLIDGFGPDGISARVLDVTRRTVMLQSGYLYHYAFVMLIGVAVMITWFLVKGATG